MELITTVTTMAFAAILIISVGMILQKTMNMLVAQQEIEEAEEDSRISGWLLVMAAVACAVLVL